MKKKVFYTELAYCFGLLFLALGTALMANADFGVSMVVAPAYILHLKISEYIPLFSFGMAEYVFQAFLLIVMTAVLRKFKLSYLLSFGTTVVYGLMLDGVMALLPADFGPLSLRLIFYSAGFLLCSAGVSLLFHSYVPPEAYELFVKEIAAKFGLDIHKFKTAYDCASCLLAVFMSFMFFGFGVFRGVQAGTVICAFLNGWLISRCTKFFESCFEFKDRFSFGRYF